MFALVLETTYLYNWYIYWGKSDPLTGEGSMYRLIYDILLDSGWDHSGAILYCDAAFTSIKLFQDLANKRGIYAVGPINARGGSRGPLAWPHQKYDAKHTAYLPRGWFRAAYRKMQGGKWMQAAVWRDSKFVKILSTTHMLNGNCKVKRWIRAAKDRLPVEAPHVVVGYQEGMPWVDRFDKTVALTKMRLRRCKLRIHRAPFVWALAGLGVNNTLLLFDGVSGEAAELRKKWTHNGLGYVHWYQDELADVLIEHGLQLSSAFKIKTAARIIQRAALTCLYKDPNPRKRTRRLSRGHLHLRWHAAWRPASYSRLPSWKRKTFPTPTVAPVTNPAPVVATRRSARTSTVPSRRKRGRPASTTTPTPRPRVRKKPSPQEQQRLDRLEFVDHRPTFTPKTGGRKAAGAVGDCITLGKRHHRWVRATKRKGEPVQPARDRDKSYTDRCPCCYSRVRNPIGGGRKTKIATISRTNHMCNECGTLLCQTCFFYFWDHKLGRHTSTHGMIVVSPTLTPPSV